MGVASEHSVGKGTNIELQLNLDGHEIDVNANVVWCQESRSVFAHGSYAIGLRFEGLGASDQLLIREYIRVRASDSPESL